MTSSTTPACLTLGVAALLIAAGATAAPAQSLKKRLTKHLDSGPLTHHHWGVAVLDDDGKLIFDRDATVLLGPDRSVDARLVTSKTVEVGRIPVTS